jgi:putative oxidoreductase
MNGTIQLIIAAALSFIASFLHIAIIFGGADWYRFFGAGEKMAKLAESGSAYSSLVTAAIAIVLFIWGLYALSGAGVILKLPFLRLALVAITSAFLLRGLAGLILPFVTSHPAVTQNSTTFWIVSSAICLILGAFYLFGTMNRWANLVSDAV